MRTSLSMLCQINMLNSCIRQFESKINCGWISANRCMNTHCNAMKQLFVTADKKLIKHQNCRLFISATKASSTSPGVLSQKQAKDLAIRLTSDERDVLISALQECQSQQNKAEYEGQLAAFRWRSKFGRPTSVPSLGQVDPTGSYCTVPDDWLLKKYAETVPHPHRRDLMRLFVANAIPFIGFGFLDNLFMILAGERIDASLGAVISLSTMTSAAFGNTISDILGIGCTPYVEKLAQIIGFKPPKLTLIQLNLPSSRRVTNLGRVIGVTIGCILGMVPLLFNNREPMREEETKNQD